jgi:drug/metabolite transporter (DMT)-like permease
LTLGGAPLSGDELGSELSDDPAVPPSEGAIRSGGMLGAPVCGVPGITEGTGAGVVAGPAVGLEIGGLDGGVVVCAEAANGRARAARRMMERIVGLLSENGTPAIEVGLRQRWFSFGFATQGGACGSGGQPGLTMHRGTLPCARDAQGTRTNRMEFWIPVTLCAALFQTWRTALQQKLRNLLSINGAGFVRFLYGAPTALVLLALSMLVVGVPLPAPNAHFLMWCVLGGLTQILGTNLLIMAFGFRNFAVGTAYSKTEAAQTAVIAWITLGEVLKPLAWLGIMVGLSGVMTLSLAGRGLQPREMLRASVQPAALCGLSAGLLFGFTAIFIKLANQSLEGPSIVVRAIFALFVTNTLQTFMQGSWLAWREPRELRKAFTTWRSSCWAGTLSACGSACWFTAFALAEVALVRSVGQVEIVFTLLFSRFYLKETLKFGDVAGLILVAAGVVLIVLSS